ncbi:hypothetical protein P5P86_03425 [Nocardioides sp. BP30]|uniref:hypothetical protein n=1 Tax=Nocardioides sp. BP30 TaxID=3036374 RepID=UPI002468BD9B|nr:hypothetical protein [Nocardioides sp. BP30]WGL52880.1 hypothetical protein P5P86_03425 [Nocardioides sp. BP30]
MSVAVRPFPADTAVLHIGPHKTGTTALQQAMRQAREAMLAQGVRVAGRGPGDGDAARYAIRLTPIRGEEFGREAWDSVKADLADPSVPRRIFSRETFANAGDARAGRLIEELGPVQVVLSARPLAELIPSQYSQFVQSGICTRPFESWLDLLFADDAADADERSVRLFWKRHRHDVQVRRWGSLVGAERITVVVVDHRDRLFLARSFEQLLDLRAGTLVDPIRSVRQNRSLTLAELELVRRWQELAVPSGASRSELFSLGWQLCSHLRRHDAEPADGSLTLPSWAVGEANRRAAASADEIIASGARVVGELGRLSAASPPSVTS